MIFTALTLFLCINAQEKDQTVKLGVRFELPTSQDVKWHLVNNPSEDLNRFVRSNYLLYLSEKEVDPIDVNKLNSLNVIIITRDE